MHLMDGSTLFAFPFMCWWAFSLFLTWALKNTAAVNIGGQVYIWTPALNSLDVYLGVELPKHMTIQFSQSCPTLCNPMNCSMPVSLSITNSQSPPKSMSIESMMPSSYLILCCPLLLLPSVFPSIRVFSSESALHIRWPKYWSFSFSISPSNEYSGLISLRIDWLYLLAVQAIHKSLL